MDVIGPLLPRNRRRKQADKNVTLSASASVPSSRDDGVLRPATTTPLSLPGKIPTLLRHQVKPTDVRVCSACCATRSLHFFKHPVGWLKRMLTLELSTCFKYPGHFANVSSVATSSPHHTPVDIPRWGVSYKPCSTAETSELYI